MCIATDEQVRLLYEIAYAAVCMGASPTVRASQHSATIPSWHSRRAGAYSLSKQSQTHLEPHDPLLHASQGWPAQRTPGTQHGSLGSRVHELALEPEWQPPNPVSIHR